MQYFHPSVTVTLSRGPWQFLLGAQYPNCKLPVQIPKATCRESATIQPVIVLIIVLHKGKSGQVATIIWPIDTARNIHSFFGIVRFMWQNITEIRNRKRKKHAKKEIVKEGKMKTWSWQERNYWQGKWRPRELIQNRKLQSDVYSYI